MAKKKLGAKHTCYQCGCKFYDLARSQAICPKCGADQSEAPKREGTTPPRATPSVSSSSRSRPRRKVNDDLLETPDTLDDEDGKVGELEDGLSMIDDEDLEAGEGFDDSEED